MLMAITAIGTYAALILPGRLSAEQGPPPELLAAATGVALQESSAGAEASPAFSSGVLDINAMASPSPAPTIETTATGNPFGEWQLSSDVEVEFWISIPNIELEAPIVSFGSRERLVDGVQVNRLLVPNSFAVAWDASSAQPGLPGNAVLSGHNNLYGGVFSRLGEIQPGWEVAIWSPLGVFSYYVEEILLIEETGQPLDVRLANAANFMGPSGDTRLTLITCGPGRANTHRLIIIARP